MKVDLKKHLGVALLLTILPLASCAQVSNELTTINVYHDNYSIEGNFHSLKYDVDYPFSISGEYQLFTDYDNNTYHADLAKLGMLFSTNIYNTVEPSAMVNGESEKGEQAIFDALGVEDYQSITLESEDYSLDSYDTTRFQIAHRSYPYYNENKEVVFLVFSGTANKEEWLSDMDLGATENYANLTGEHPDYQDSTYHKGIDVAFHRAMPLIENYLQEYNLVNAGNSLFICGHSRGGGLANLAGAYFEKLNQFHTFTYTFASPRIINGVENNYNSIFNVVNEQDFVGALAPSYYGFERYGKDVFFDSADFEDSFNEETKLDYGSLNLDVLLDKFKAIAPSLDDLYTMKNDGDHQLFSSLKKCYSSKEQAEKKINSLVSTYLADYSPSLYHMEVEKREDGYYILAYDCPALSLQALALIANFASETANAAREVIKAAYLFSGSQLELVTYFVRSGTGLGCNHEMFTYLSGLNHLKE